MDNKLLELKAALGFAQAMLCGIQASLDAFETDLAMEAPTREPVPFAGSYAQRHADAVSPDVPEGYDTILGYLAKHHPDILDFAYDYSAPLFTQRDGWKLSHLAKAARAPTVYVRAPECLQAHDIDHVRAYPIALLAKRWA